MKNKIILFILCSSFFAGCKKDFLEKPPLDVLENSTFWTSEANVRTFTYFNYTRYFPGYSVGFDLGFGGFYRGESLNDDFASNTPFTAAVPSSSLPWSNTNVNAGNAFTWIRRHNIMMDRVKTVPMSQEAKLHWTGVARFFRGLEHASMVSTYGDFPWVNKVYDENDPELFKPRDPRTLVMDSVLADFQYAAANVRASDGTEKTNVNKYVVLARMAKVFLFEGTWQKYHFNNTAKATQYLEASKWAANEIMISNKYSLAPDYRSLFNSLDLQPNPEIILFRRYDPGILMHSLMSYNNVHEAQDPGASKDAIDAYLAKDGLPIGISTAYQGDKTVYPGNGRRLSAAMINRDPRIKATFADSLRIEGQSSQFAYSKSGFAVVKFLNESLLNTVESLSQTNSSDAPEIRYGEVLITYAEAAAELGTLTQTDLDNTINKLRARTGVPVADRLPRLQIIGGNPAVNNTVYDDPERDPTVPSMIWEIRRERRVELMMEGFRNDDLRRWKKLEYADQILNKDVNRGGWVKRSDYPGLTAAVITENNAAAGYIIPVPTAGIRVFNPRNYLEPIGADQIKLYKDRGVVLTQNPGWQ